MHQQIGYGEGMSDRAQLNPEVYAHLHKLAQQIYRERGKGHQTIQPTVLLHEAWMKISSSKNEYASKAHFMAVAARAMRQIMIDRGRHQNAKKRGGADLMRTTLTGLADEPDQVIDALALEDALRELEGVNARAAEVLMQQIFGGMTANEIAEVHGITRRTVERCLRFAKAFMADKLGNSK